MSGLIQGDKFEYVSRSWRVLIAEHQKMARSPELDTKISVSREKRRKDDRKIER